MAVDGVLAQHQPHGNLSVRQAFSKETQDLELPRRNVLQPVSPDRDTSARIHHATCPSSFGAAVTIQSWRRPSREERDAVEAEVESLPLPDIGTRIRVQWDDATA